MPLINKLVIIGVGLIGGSLARALRDKGEVGEIVGIGRTEANLRRAVDLGVIDRYTHDPVSGVAGADMVFLAMMRKRVKLLTWSSIRSRTIFRSYMEAADSLAMAAAV